MRHYDPNGARSFDQGLILKWDHAYEKLPRGTCYLLFPDFWIDPFSKMKAEWVYDSEALALAKRKHPLRKNIARRAEELIMKSTMNLLEDPTPSERSQSNYWEEKERKRIALEKRRKKRER